VQSLRESADPRQVFHRLACVVITTMVCAALLIESSPATADPLFAGVIASHERLTVTGLGDSVPAGSVCGCAPYVTLFADSAAQTVQASPAVTNLARGGLTSGGLLAQLSAASVASAIARSDVVIVTIGANDFDEGTLTRPGCTADGGLACDRRNLARLESHLASALSTIDTLISGRRAQVLVTGYWNVFKDGQVARAHGNRYVAESDLLTRAVNALIRREAERHGATYVDLYQPFRGPGMRDDTALLAADGDHPNARGHTLIADLLLAAWVAR
jgi:lysophospholipase L1-like esterase